MILDRLLQPRLGFPEIISQFRHIWVGAAYGHLNTGGVYRYPPTGEVELLSDLHVPTGRAGGLLPVS